MFRKQIKIKSNTAMKSSAGRKLFHKILLAYSKITEEDLNDIFEKQISEVKFVVPNKHGIFYCSNSVPLFFEVGDLIAPTIFALKKKPGMLSKFVVHESVVERLSNGADLMIPGVRPLETSETNPYGVFTNGEVMYVCTLNSPAPVAVGISTISNLELESKMTTHGKAMRVLHTVQDGIFKLGIGHNTPLLRSPSPDDKDKESIVEEMSNLDVVPKLSSEEAESFLSKYIASALRNTNPDELPILVNVFYSTKFLILLPSNCGFDIKKTKHKKISVYLKQLSNDNVLTYEDIKGVQRITSINKESPFIKMYAEKKSQCCSEEKPRPHVSITEKYRVTAQGAKVLKCNGFEKGDLVTAQDVRISIMKYLKSNGISGHPTNRELVLIDDLLKSVLRVQTRELTWKDMYEKFFSALSLVHEFTFPNGEKVIRTGKIQLITLRTAVRSNSKKVTIISNLPLYGIDPKMFAQSCQLATASSATVLDSSEVQIQGDQCTLITKLLINNYNIPKKYITGGD